MAEETLVDVLLSVVTDQFKTLQKPDTAGKVYRVLAEEPVPIYDCPTQGANIMRRLLPGALVIGYSSLGEMRQIHTADEVFGYIKRTVTLLPVAGLDAEGLYDPERRGAVEATLPPLKEMGAAYTDEQIRNKRNQYYFMAGFILVILLGLCSTLLHSPASPAK